MAEGGDKSLEEIMKQVEDLELLAKRKEKLVNQRRQERAEMEAENARIKRQLKYMEEELEWEKETIAEIEKEQCAKAPFSGKGFSLKSPSPAQSSAPEPVSLVHYKPVSVDPGKPSGAIQVRLDGG